MIQVSVVLLRYCLMLLNLGIRTVSFDLYHRFTKLLRYDKMRLLLLLVIKTGSSGLIAYRWQTKELTWIWLQSSCRVVYKNSKPDFVICTHRQLT